MILVIYPLIGLTEDQVKEGQPIDLTCASLQDVNDLFSDDPVPQRLFVSAEKALGNYDSTRIQRQIFKGSPTSSVDSRRESHTAETWTAKMVGRNSSFRF